MSEEGRPQDSRFATSRLFARESEIEIEGVRFRIRRLTLKEELEWMAERDRILADQSRTREEKVVEIWGALLRRVLIEPKLENPLEELPAAVISLLITEIEKLQMWDVPFRNLSRASG